MKNLNRNQKIAVAISLVVVAYLVFGNSFMSLFGASQTQDQTNTQMSQPTGVMIQDVNVGTGAEAQVGDKVTVHYVGQLTNGKVFDSSRDRNQPFQFTLGAGQVIRGWDEGLLGMKVGGKRVLTISPEYGYGNQSIGSIPANSTLIFEVELLGIEK